MAIFLKGPRYPYYGHQTGWSFNSRACQSSTDMISHLRRMLFSAPGSVNEEILQVIGAGCTIRCVQNVGWIWPFSKLGFSVKQGWSQPKKKKEKWKKKKKPESVHKWVYFPYFLYLFFCWQTCKLDLELYYYVNAGSAAISVTWRLQFPQLYTQDWYSWDIGWLYFSFLRKPTMISTLVALISTPTGSVGGFLLLPFWIASVNLLS